MNKTIVVNKYKEPFEIDISRNSCWGNPWSHEPKSRAKYIVTTREEAIEKYRHWILGQIELIAKLGEIKGKVLGCFCKGYHNDCHGDILCILADNFDETKEFNDYSAFW